MMRTVVIDGKKMLSILHISEETVTPELIRDTLLSLSLEERIKLEEECVVHVDDITPHLSLEMLAVNDVFKFTNTDDRFEYTEVELKRLIKYERNPMRKKELQRELSTMNMWNGKHRRGKRRSYYG